VGALAEALTHQSGGEGGMIAEGVSSDYKLSDLPDLFFDETSKLDER
jgi:hypothetical protein